jgi:hypothetical protein
MIKLTPTESAALGCTHVVEVVLSCGDTIPDFYFGDGRWVHASDPGTRWPHDCPSTLRRSRPATPEEISRDNVQP